MNTKHLIIGSPALEKATALRNLPVEKINQAISETESLMEFSIPELQQLIIDGQESFTWSVINSDNEDKRDHINIGRCLHILSELVGRINNLTY